MIELEPSETVVNQTYSSNVLLTSQRLIYPYDAKNSSYKKSIYLDDLLSIKLESTRNPIFLIMAILCFSARFAFDNSLNDMNQILFYAIASIVFLILFFLSKRKIIYARSPITFMAISTSEKTIAQANELIEIIEKTKEKWMKELEEEERGKAE
jgi:hypothetical protein